MTTLLYGRPPAVFDPPGDAIQTSPLIPDSAALEAQTPGSADTVTIYAPPGVLERRYTLALALRALKVGGRLDVMAPKDKGGSRLGKELKAFGLEVAETAKAHHRRCVVIRPDTVQGLDAAIAAGGPQIVPGLDAWSQPGIFAWDRIDPGSALLIEHLPRLAGRGADLGSGLGVLSRAAPALNPIQLGLPVSVLVGLFLIAMLAGEMGPPVQRLYDAAFDAAGRVPTGG